MYECGIAIKSRFLVEPASPSYAKVTAAASDRQAGPESRGDTTVTPRGDGPLEVAGSMASDFKLGLRENLNWADGRPR